MEEDEEDDDIDEAAAVAVATAVTTAVTAVIPSSPRQVLPRRSKSSLQQGINTNSLSKARDRLHSRGKASPSPRSAPRRGMSDSLVGLVDGTSSSSSSSNKDRRPRQRTSSGRSNEAVEPILESPTHTTDSGSQRRDRASLRRGRRSSDEPMTPTAHPQGDEAAAAGTTTTTTTSEERGRSSRKKGSSRNGSRSRSRGKSRSKSAKRRGGGHRKVALPKGDEKESSVALSSEETKLENETEKEPPATGSATSTTTTSSTIKSTSVRVRRKPASSSLAGLSMLDNLMKSRVGSRGSRSVGTDMMLNSPPKKPKSATTTTAPPQRKVVRTHSQDAGGIASLANFLTTSTESSSSSTTHHKKSNKKSSSRSVSSLPVPRTSGGSSSGSVGGNGGGSGSGEAPKKPLRRRLKNMKRSSGNSVQSDGEPAMRGHRSFGSGLDMHSASHAPTEEKRGRKPAVRGHRSFGSGLDLHSAASDDTHNNTTTNDDGPHEDYTSDLLGDMMSDDEDDTPKRPHHGGRLGRSMGDIPAFKASDLGSLLAQQKEQKRLSRETGASGDGGGASVLVADEGVDDNQEDIFSYYSWSTSRQARNKIQKERKLLSDALRQGAFLAAYESFVRME
jgi:hypothetical protein